VVERKNGEQMVDQEQNDEESVNVVNRSGGKEMVGVEQREWTKMDV